MKRKIAVIVPNLTDAHREKILASAERNGCEVRFLATHDEDAAYVNESEIVFGHQPRIAASSDCLRWLCTPFAGVDQFLAKDSFANPEAILTNSSGAYGVAIAEHVLMLLLAILRREPEYNTFVRKKEWKRDLPVRSVFGSRITLLGTGDIGLETAKRLKAFSPASVVGVNRSGGNPENAFDRIVTGDRLAEVLPETDILIISLPGTGATYHMIGKDELASLPDGAVLINVGRGSVIDRYALAEGLESGRLYAGLDVFEQEPIPQDDSLWTQRNLLLTPHVAGNMALAQTVDRIVDMFLEDLERYCAGAPLLHLVDRDRGY